MSESLPDFVRRSPAKVLLWRALVSGETFNKHGAAVRFGWHLSTADRAINELHEAGLVHIVGWVRNGDRGPMTKVVAFGQGKDLPRPKPLTNAFVCQRWRNRHPDQALAIDRNCKIKRKALLGMLPKGRDPLLEAIMGISL